MLIGQTECFALKFANIVGKLMRKKLELLYEQFHEYKTIVDAKLPDEAYGEALLSGTSDGCAKSCWANYLFKLLFEVARIILIIPHSMELTPCSLQCWYKTFVFTC